MSFSRILATGLTAVIGLAAAVSTAHATPPAVGDATKVWQQTFSDNFDSPIVDPLKWSTCYFWVSAGGCNNSGNGELQWYQPGNVFASNGTLKLRAQKQRVLAPSGKTYDYTSGMISSGRSTSLLSTPPRYDFTYGYAETRMKLPKGQGLWPAFWMLPSSQGWPPELDVFEYIGSKPTTLSMNDHYRDAAGTPQTYGRWYTGPDFSAGWHTVGIDWQPNLLVWYIDGVVRHFTTDPQMIPDEPMYLLANLAVGGSWPGAPDATTVFPADYELDYIKVWQRVPAPTAPLTTTLTAPTTTTATTTTPTTTTTSPTRVKKSEQR